MRIAGRWPGEMRINAHLHGDSMERDIHPDMPILYDKPILNFSAAIQTKRLEKDCL